MEMILQASPRTVKGKKLKSLRSEGVLPGVVYGPKESTLSVSLSLKEFEKLFSTAGESTLIVLKGLDSDKEVLVHDVAHDPLTGTPLHVDFYAVEQGKLLQVHVPIEFVGEAPVLKSGSAMLTKVLLEVEVECLPRAIPQHLELDLSILTEIGATLHLKDIVLPEGVTLVADGDDTVVVVSEVVEEIEAPVEVPDMAAIDVEKKGKKDEEEVEAE